MQGTRDGNAAASPLDSVLNKHYARKWSEVVTAPGSRVEAWLPVSEAREVWFYERVFLDDSVVFVGSAGQVLCCNTGEGDVLLPSLPRA